MFEILIYETRLGRFPFEEWLNALADRRARAILRIRIDRLKFGNFGNAKNLGDGISELIIDYGPGYRIYFAKAGLTLIILLWGGSKKTQAIDIQTAKSYWKEYKARGEK